MNATPPPAPAAPAQAASPGPALPPLRSGQTIVYLLDRSGSMGYSGRFDAARQWVIGQLSQLPPDVRFQVIAYNRYPEVCPLAGGPLSATPANCRAAAEWLAGLQTEGGSNHRAALQQALVLGADVICLLTDGEEASGNWVRPVGAAVYTVGFSPTGGAALAELARLNRGRYQVLNP